MGNPRRLLLVGSVASLAFLLSCTSEPMHVVEDPCAVKPVLAGGTAELGLGLGQSFMPVVTGQDVYLQLGAQGLWMFPLAGRVRDMNVGAGDHEGIIDAAVLDKNGQEISFGSGCRLREFVETDDGSLQFTSPYLTPLIPSVMVDGTTVTLRLQVRDTEGRQATDERAVVARVPAQAP